MKIVPTLLATAALLTLGASMSSTASADPAPFQFQPCSMSGGPQGLAIVTHDMDCQAAIRVSWAWWNQNHMSGQTKVFAEGTSWYCGNVNEHRPGGSYGQCYDQNDVNRQLHIRS
jgi:hypothetical protein